MNIKKISLLFFYLSIIGFSFLNAADKYNVEGVVKGVNGQVQINLIDGVKDYDDKTDRKGFFKLKKVLRGEYTLQVVKNKEIIHEQSIYVNRDKKIKVVIGNNYISNEFRKEHLDRLIRPEEESNSYDTSVPVVGSIDFYVDDNNQLIITYYLNPKNYSDKYKINIKISDNNGFSWFTPKSLSGDIGIIYGLGQKKVIWDVFKDREELDGDIVIDIIAVLEKPINKYISDTEPSNVSPNYETAEINKSLREGGLYFSINSTQTNFLNPTFEKRIKSKSIILNEAVGFGLSIMEEMVILDYDITESQFIVNTNYSDISILSELVESGDYYNDDYDGSFKVGSIAHNIGLSTIIFPKIYISPVIGLGVQFSKLVIFKYGGSYSDQYGESEDGVETYDDKYSLGTSDIYLKGGLTFSGNKYNLDMYIKRSVISTKKAWVQLQVNLGINIFGSLY